MNLIRSIAVVLLCSMLVACVSATKSSSLKVEEVISDKIVNAIIEYNQSKTFALGVESSAENKQTIKYIIIREEDCEIIYEGMFRPGYIKWLNDTEIELFDSPEIINDNDDLTKYRKIIFVGSMRKL
jgi:hypothetical protein